MSSGKPLDRVFKLFTSNRNKQFIVDCIITSVNQAGISIPSQAIMGEIQLHIDSVWVDNIQNLALRFNSDPKSIIHHLNNTLVNYYTRHITSSAATSRPAPPVSSVSSSRSGDVEYHQPDDFFDTSSSPKNELVSQDSTVASQVDLSIINKELESLALSSTRKKSKIFNYLASSNSASQKLNGVNLGNVEEIRCVKFEYFNNIYSVKSFKFSIKLSVSSTPVKYTFPGGNYLDYRSVLRALSDITLESNVVWIYDELLGRTRVEWRSKQDKGPSGSQFAPKVEHFVLTFSDSSDSSLFGFSQTSYSGGKMYMSECCHRFGIPPRIDVRLNNVLHKYSGNTPFVSFRIQRKKFGEWITEYVSAGSGTGYIKLLDPIILDDLVVDVSGIDGSEWCIELQIKTIES